VFNVTGWSNYSISEPLFCGGEGTLEEPYEICSWTQLNNTRLNMSAYYALNNSLDSGMEDYSGIGDDWQPIGTNATLNFSGNFNGQGNIIYNLTISRGTTDSPENYYLGLFGYVSGGNLSNINLVNVNITGHAYVGGLVGYQVFSSITNSSSTSTLTGGSNSSVFGGLVGAQLSSNITDSSSTSTLTGGSNSSVFGGLVGVQYISSIITDSSSTSTLTGGSNSSFFGGLVGAQLSSNITDSSSTSTLTGGSNSSFFGGLVGAQLSSNITDSSSTSTLTGGSNSSFFGGLVGSQWSSSTITNSSSTSTLTGGSGSNQFGGLVGSQWSSSTITNSIVILEDSGNLSAGANVSLIVNNISGSVTNTYGTIRDSSFGNITFLTWNVTNPNGGNLLDSIQINNNSAYVNGSIAGYNKSANVTLIGLRTDYSNPVIMKDGVECTDCYNFTSLNAGTVKFNVTGWSNYSIGETPSISLERIYPLGNINVTQNEFFNITLNVTCLDNDCGDVNVSFDPEDLCDGSPTNANCWSTTAYPNPATGVGYLWSNDTGTATGITSTTDGAGNTADLAALGSNYEAATYCNTLTEGGVPPGTWYLPAKDQLVAALNYHKDSLEGGFGDFTFYWSSTEGSASYAWGAYYDSFFDDVDTYNVNKGDTSRRVRCLRDAVVADGKNLIPVSTGSPFYTNSSTNPVTETNMQAGESRLVTIWVNATGEADSTHTFFEFANLTSNMEISNITGEYNVTIVEESLFAGGNGTSGNPYQITSWTHLNNTRLNLSAHYVLNNSLNSEDDDYDSIGNNWTPIGDCGGNECWNDPNNPFNGSFNGQGFTISNLSIYLPDVYGVGFFARLGLGSSVSNLNLLVDDIYGYSYTGGLSGQLWGGSITNCSVIVYGIINGYSHVGGFLGYTSTLAFIKDSSIEVKGTIQANNNNAGGFIGYHSGSILNSSVVVDGTIFAFNNTAGGLVGRSMSGSIINSSITISGIITSNYNSAGIVGMNNGSITNSLLILYDSATINSDNGNIGLVVGIDYRDEITDSFGTVLDSTNGNITFLDWNVSKADGGNLLDYIYIENNSAYVNSTASSGLNKSANITLLNLPTDMINPKIMKDGEPCTDCYNFTSLNAGNVTFNVTGWSNYSIGEAEPLFCGGSGSELDPYLICTWTHLNNTRLNLTAHYVLNNSLSAEDADYLTFNSGEGWLPIGNESERFRGSFNGFGYEIQRLFINRSLTDYIGLFGYIYGANISNVGVFDVEIVGGDSVGGLVGYGFGSSIVTDCYSLGNVTGSNNVGGLIGGITSSTNIVNSYSVFRVAGNSSVGGLVGHSSGTISNSYSSGILRGAYWRVGGLVGRQQEGTISNSYSFGSLNGSWYVGGLVGYQNEGARISSSYSETDVEGIYPVGGLVGRVGGNISNSYSIGNVTRVSGSSANIGGIIGENYMGKILNSYSTGAVHQSPGVLWADGSKGFVGSQDIGGFYEDEGNFFDISTSGQISTTGNATGLTTKQMKDIQNYIDAGWDISLSDEDLNNGYPYLGWQGENESYTWLIPLYEEPLFCGGSGTSEEPFQICSWTHLNNTRLNLSAHYVLNNSLTADDGDYDTLGNNWMPIGTGSGANSFSGNFNGNGNTISNLSINLPETAFVGLFGYVTGNISNVNLVSVNVTGSDRVGGLVGLLANPGSIFNSSSSGNVLGNFSIGGLVGLSSGIISNSYVLGNVTGFNYVGGFLGWSNGGSSLISNSSFSGMVSGSGTVGGLVGQKNGGLISNSFVTLSDSATLESITSIGLISGHNIGNIENTYATIYNEDYGNITFLDWNVTNEDGGNLLDYIFLENNLAGVDSVSKPGMNKSANVTLLNLPTDFVNPKILKDGVECTDCYNFTSLNAGNVTFNVSGFSNYSIQEEPLFCGGTGSELDPYLICTWTHLNNTRLNLTAHYILNNSLSAVDDDYINNFEPIGYNSNLLDQGYCEHNDCPGDWFCSFEVECEMDWGEGPGVWVSLPDTLRSFSGSFNGNNYIISNLSINLPSKNNVGLFGHSTGNISNLKVEVDSIIGNESVGGIVGHNLGYLFNLSTIIYGSIKAQNSVGGLVGYIEGGILNSSSSNIIGNISAEFYSAGGLIGSSYLGDIINSYSTIFGNISSLEGSGGLVGNQYMGVEIINSSSEIIGTIYASENYAGGIVGKSDSDITHSFSNISGIIYAGDSGAGGIAGYLSEATLLNSSAIISGTISALIRVGGLVGETSLAGKIYESHSIIKPNANVSGNSAVGGLSGISSGGYIYNSSTIVYDNATINAYSGSVGLVLGSYGESFFNNLTGIIVDSNFGNITFLDWDVRSLDGGNLTEFIYLDFNSANVNSSAKAGFNKSANVTLLNTGIFEDAIILKDGIECTDCVMLSSDGDNYTFNVTGWSNYLIGEELSPCPNGWFGGGTHASPCQVTECNALSIPGLYYKLQSNLTSIDGCFSITADNIILDGSGFVLEMSSCDGGGDGINANYKTNLTIKNFADIRGFIRCDERSYAGIKFQYVTNSFIINSTVSYNSMGIYFYSSSNNIISNVSSHSNQFIGLDLIVDSNNNTLHNVNIFSNPHYEIRFTSTSYNLNFNNTFGDIIFNNLSLNIFGDLIFGDGQNIQLGDNYAYLNSDNLADLNKPANITLYNIGDRGFTNQVILKDGAYCTDCYNFTSLTAETVQFNVTSWSNYSIGEKPNQPPNKPELNYPIHGSINQIINPILNVTVTDPEGDLLNVTFINNLDQSIICQNNSVTNGSYVTCTWSDLIESTTYNWYANVTDGEFINQSGIWNFTTGDFTEPTLSVPELYSGNYYPNESSGSYFNGMMGIRSFVNDLGGSGLNQSSCEININNIGWIDAIYDSNYCNYEYSLTENITSVQFRIKDNSDNLGISLASNFIYDNIAPEINLITPQQNNYVGWEVLLKANATDNSLVSNIWYEIRNETTLLLSGLSNNQAFEDSWITNETYPYDVSLYDNMNFTFIVYANDTFGNLVNKTINFTLDNTKPNIQFIAPTSEGSYYNSNFTLEIFYSNSFLTYINYSINNTLLNETIVNGKTFRFEDNINVDLLSEDNYTIITYAEDLIGNNRTLSSWFVIDKSFIEINVPEIYSGLEYNQEYFKGMISIRSNVTQIGLSPLNKSSCMVKINEGDWILENVSFNEDSCVYSNFEPHEDFSIKFKISNYAGTTDTSSEKIFIYDNNGPTINILSPENIIYNYNDILINITANDVSGINESWYSWDGLNKTYEESEVVIMPDGVYNLTVWANDSLGNLAYELVEFEIDTIYPLFSNYQDNNGTLFGSGLGLFNVSVENTNGIVLLDINNVNISAVNLVDNIFSVNYELFQNGTYEYKWHSWGNGTKENYNISETREYVVNYNTPPFMVSVILNSTDMSLNNTEQNLTCYALATDIDGTNLIYSGRWLKNGVEHKIIDEVLSLIYDGGYEDSGASVATDSLNNIYVTGYSFFEERSNFYTIKYDSLGNELWNRTYDGGWNDTANAIALDELGNIYVAGSSSNGLNVDYYTIKYDSDGNELWSRRYDPGLSSSIHGIAIDRYGYLYVIGEARAIGSPTMAHLIKYDYLGNEVMNITYDIDKSALGRDVVLDSNNNIYILLRSDIDNTPSFHTVKYDYFGNYIWNKTYNSGYIDYPRVMVVDSLDNIYVGGMSSNPFNEDYYLIKYDSDGNEIWNRRYDGGFDDRIHGMAIDSSDNIYVTGRSFNGSFFNSYTIKYDSEGNELWNLTLFSSYAGDHISRKIFVDSLGYFYLVGKTSNSLNDDYFVNKYSQGFISYDNIEGQEVLVSTLDSSYISGGDIWACEVRAYDGNKFSELIKSNEIEILDPELFCGGEGTELDPFKICTWTHLNNTRLNLTAHYVLNNSLDSETEGYDGLASSSANSGLGWIPIGDCGDNYCVQEPNILFEGSFDGQNFSIFNLTINSSGKNGVGLFGASSGNISNIILFGVNISAFNESIGGLVGWQEDGIINNCFVQGNIQGSGFKVGGLVGRVGGTVVNSYSDININIDTEQNAIGGLAGTISGIVINSSSVGIVNVSGEYVGGLVGRLYNGSIVDSYSSVNVYGDSHVGGLVGRHFNGSIINSYSTGNVIGNNSIGGLIGSSMRGKLYNSSLNITGTILGISEVGALIGTLHLEGVVSNSTAIIFNSANIIGETNIGFIGLSSGEVNDSYLSFINQTHGEITFLDWDVSKADGGNLLDYIFLENNLAGVDSISAPGFNISANVTLLNIGDRGFTNPVILKDDVECLDCYNFTSLTADTVKFNVTGWSNYSIGEKPNSPPDKPELNYPLHNSYNNLLNIILNVTVTDPDGDSMNVTFVNNLDQSIICQNNSVLNGSYVLCTWYNLDETTIYEWYVNVTDGEYINQSDIWNFTTGVFTDPEVSTPELYSGNYYPNENSGAYFKGLVGVQSFVSDSSGSGLNETSCEVNVNLFGWIDANYNGTHCQYIYDDLSDITTIQFRIKDNANNLGVSSVSNFIYDSDGPEINILSPENIIYPYNNILFNLTFTDLSGVNKTWYNWNGTNHTYYGADNIVIFNGDYNLSVWANDSLGNIGYQFVEFSVNSTIPAIFILSPENKIYKTTEINLNVFSDNVIHDWWYSLNYEDNISFIPNSSIAAREGVNILTVYANNSLGFVGLSSVAFTLDLSPPQSTSPGGGSTSSITNEIICAPSWKCTAWADCINTRQTRLCYDENNCGSVKNMPSTRRTCISESDITKEENYLDPKIDDIDKNKVISDITSNVSEEKSNMLMLSAYGIDIPLLSLESDLEPKYVNIELNLNKGRRTLYIEFIRNIEHIRVDDIFVLKLFEGRIRQDTYEGVVKIYYKGRLIEERVFYFTR
jgi:hypothetical protein